MTSRGTIRVLEVLKYDMSDRSKSRIFKIYGINFFRTVVRKVFDVEEICGCHFI